MIFQEKFKEIIESCESSKGIVLIGRDGIVVDQYFEGDPPEEMVIELSESLKRTAMIWESRGSFVEEDIIITKDDIFVINYLSDYYYLFLIIEKGGNIGKSRFILRKNKTWFKKEII